VARAERVAHLADAARLHTAVDCLEGIDPLGLVDSARTSVQGIHDALAGVAYLVAGGGREKEARRVLGPCAGNAEDGRHLERPRMDDILRRHARHLERQWSVCRTRPTTQLQWSITCEAPPTWPARVGRAYRKSTTNSTACGGASPSALKTYNAVPLMAACTCTHPRGEPPAAMPSRRGLAPTRRTLRHPPRRRPLAPAMRSGPSRIAGSSCMSTAAAAQHHHHFVNGAPFALAHSDGGPRTPGAAALGGLDEAVVVQPGATRCVRARAARRPTA
jgi:hypothetical protein